jgi:hypothetical protein
VASTYIAGMIYNWVKILNIVRHNVVNKIKVPFAKVTCRGQIENVNIHELWDFNENV